ncbi:MAG TPA: hypothetical protein VJ742_13405 [Nitrososphaera sp.]|nr:hypothetical protein [Nitrososphaera sp.]
MAEDAWAHPIEINPYWRSVAAVFIGLSIAFYSFLLGIGLSKDHPSSTEELSRIHHELQLLSEDMKAVTLK